MRQRVKAVAIGARLVPRGVAMAVYRIPLLATAIRRVLNASLTTASESEPLQLVEVVHGPLRGARFMLDLSKEKYFWLGTFEPWVQNAIAAHLRAGMRAWDVGGFIGYHTVMMCRESPSQVVVLEPDPENRRRLEVNLSLNQVSGVVVLPLAAGPRKATGVLERQKGFPAMTRVTSDGAEPDCSVVPLDELLDTYGRPDLIKVDVEGAEAEVLEGARRVIEQARPVWIIEIHGRQETHVATRLRRSGYHVQLLGSHRRIHYASEDLPGHILAVP
jgi:FkbM family methyltransferase